MKSSFKLCCVMGALLLIPVFGGLQVQAQTQSSHCRAEGTPRDDAGRQQCCPDGSVPDGESQCWCDPTIINVREYRNPKHEYEVQVPDGIAEILGCSGIGSGFRISLAHPDTGKGDYGMNEIVVSGVEKTRETFQDITDGWHRLKTSRQNDDVIDEQFDDPTQTSLSSLPALHLKSSHADADYGRIVSESIIANHPRKNIVYAITLVTPAGEYEKNQKLFKKIVDSFRYVPSEDSANR